MELCQGPAAIDTTAARYLRSVFSALEELGGQLADIDQSLFLDVFFALSRSTCFVFSPSWSEPCFPGRQLGGMHLGRLLLVAISASLRFADSQHIRWSSLCVSHFTLRSICFRTKTTQQGALFGLISFGVASSSSLGDLHGCHIGLRPWIGCGTHSGPALVRRRIPIACSFFGMNQVFRPLCTHRLWASYVSTWLNRASPLVRLSSTHYIT